VSTDRLESFSDGVMAIAITLLVLELRVPATSESGLARDLLEQWPSFAAYGVSFAVIGIIWVNHHAVLANVARVDRPLLFLNLLLLLFVAAIPWPTALVAEHLQGPEIDASVAVAVYGGNATAVALSFNLMWRWIVRDDTMIHDHLDVETLRATTRRFSLGLIVYPVAVGLAFVSPLAAMGVHALVALYYVVDQLAARSGTGATGPATGTSSDVP
jgi:uncharacterized membrane protein